MDAKKIALFMKLAGQKTAKIPTIADAATRELGAKLLLSEVLEYVIKGLGVTPSFAGQAITDANALDYKAGEQVDSLEMLDGLADTAYTMYWNALAFGLPLEQAFDLVCDNNLEKFVALAHWSGPVGKLPNDHWHCEQAIEWPAEVVQVDVLEIDGQFFAVGKDSSGKVRKPSSYASVDLKTLLTANN